MKQLLILHAGQTEAGPVYALTTAALAGAEVEAIEVKLLRALDARVEDLLAAHAVLFVTPEKFGYMAGALKDFLDRTFYPAQGKVEGLPYALIVAAGNDGTGAATAVARIALGYPLKPVAEPLIVRGPPTVADTQAAQELGAALAGGLVLGIF
ncbi:flavodoxin family protein [Chitinimonas sp. PSY-7]|uniref:NAD(P)H-dependent oxidoreductase n=1 Tax=Chitinimonas sp. PSY-7 TaxID=3459088 RepID=UPI0040402062